MIEINSVFKDFIGRKKSLQAITRWSIKPVMFYRPNLYVHSLHVYWILKAMIPAAQKIFGKDLDPEKMLYLGLIHDDPEIIMGDVQAGHKARMTPEQLKEIDDRERNAIKLISERFPKMIGKYVYQDLLEETHRKDTIESQLMNYADKFDAFGETLHDVFAGNKLMTEPTPSAYGLAPIPIEFYLGFMEKREQKMPLLKPLFESSDLLFAKVEPVDVPNVLAQAHPHTKDSLKEPSGYPFYDLWKKIMLEAGDEEEIQRLVTVVET